MTAIVGIEHGGRVWMGGDSAANCNGIVSLLDGGKVFRRGEFVIGGSGSARMNDLLRHVFEPPPLTEDVDAYMVRDFVPAVRACLKDAGRIGKATDESEKHDGHILVGVRGRLYELDEALAVIRCTADYNAIGSGCEVALGVLYATGGEDPRTRITMALQAAAYWTSDVRGPFTVEATER